MAVTDHNYPVTSYAITMLSRGFGWIQLKDGDKDAGYVYFTDSTGAGNEDRFGAEGSDHPYIVMHQPISLWNTFVDILRNEKPLYIRGAQSGPGQPVLTFFGNSTDEPTGEGEASHP
jgi:hypothetical protein